MGVSDLNRAFNGKYDLLYFDRWEKKDQDTRRGKKPVRDRLEALEALEAWESDSDKWELWKYSDSTEKEYNPVTDIKDARAGDISLLFALSREGKTCFVIRHQAGNYTTIDGESAELNEARLCYSEAEARDVIQGSSHPEVFKIVQVLLSTDGKLEKARTEEEKGKQPKLLSANGELEEGRMQLTEPIVRSKGAFHHVKSIRNILFRACRKLLRW
ncbi:MAG: hypothetical protein F4235_03495 [Candidatus Dadabacteria bacterium]|nr:hypothetical protein [Candidatus Dadabacteria bacterium]MYE61114.1 hypothetical protein [Candidatus Dadabacteria bacterium]MYI72862.1 hypothetical protein [Candidatus Dadabacteria bacterium]